MLPRVYVKHPAVTCYLVAGADLMVPGCVCVWAHVVRARAWACMLCVQPGVTQSGLTTPGKE